MTEKQTTKASCAEKHNTPLSIVMIAATKMRRLVNLVPLETTLLLHMMDTIRATIKQVVRVLHTRGRVNPTVPICLTVVAEAIVG